MFKLCFSHALSRFGCTPSFFAVKYNNNYNNYKLLWDSDQVKELMQKLFRRNILPKIIALGIPMGIISA
jgi:hypothetical protein